MTDGQRGQFSGLVKSKPPQSKSIMSEILVMTNSSMVAPSLWKTTSGSPGAERPRAAHFMFGVALIAFRGRPSASWSQLPFESKATESSALPTRSRSRGLATRVAWIFSFGMNGLPVGKVRLGRADARVSGAGVVCADAGFAVDAVDDVDDVDAGPASDPLASGEGVGMARTVTAPTM